MRSPGWSAWSTGPSTSAARCLPGSGSPARRSARIGACRSPTTTARWSTERPRLSDTGPSSGTVPGPVVPEGALPLGRTAALVGEYRRIEAALYAATGAWVVDMPVAAAQVHLDAQSMRHAWHAELWAERLPVVAGLDPDALTRPSGAAAALIG